MFIITANEIGTIQHSIAHFMGLDDLSGPFYGFWSGFGSDLTEIALLGTLITLYKQHKCTSCWRVGHYPVEGTPYTTCHKHTTVESHERLHKEHKLKFPMQHKFFNRNES